MKQTRRRQGSESLGPSHARILREVLCAGVRKDRFQDLLERWAYWTWATGLWRAKWLGVEVFQYPTDLAVLQRLIWETRPDFVVETGTAEGGSAVFYASILELLDHGEIISIDIDHSSAKRNLSSHPLAHRIRLLTCDSSSPLAATRVREIVGPDSKLHVFLDSDHHRAHVLHELRNFEGLVKVGDYVVVFDTKLEGAWEWRGDNPAIAVREFVSSDKNWIVDRSWEKLGATFGREGILRRIST